MSKTNSTSGSRGRQKFFDLSSILDGVKEGRFVRVVGAAEEDSEFQEGDMLLVDGQRSPRKGDVVVWDDGTGFRVSRHDDMDLRTLEYTEILGVLVTLIRDFRKRPKRSPANQVNQTQNKELKKLRDAMSRLERAPENEAERFKLETEIYRIEHGSDDNEWPDEIAA